MFMPLPRDDCVSDVVGTVMLVAVSVVLVAAAAPAVLHGVAEEPREPPELLFALEKVAAGDTAIVLRHMGGQAFPRSGLEAVVTAGSELLARVVIGDAEPWRLGQTVEVPLTRPLEAWESVEVRLVAHAAGVSLPPAILMVPGDETTSSGDEVMAQINVQFRDNRDYAVANTSSTLYLQAKVSHPEGRKAVQRVVANLSAVFGSTETPLYDDGTHGDLVAHDGTYSTHFLVPYNVPQGTYPIIVSAITLNGTRTQSTSEIVVLETLSTTSNTPYYNDTLMPKVGWNITKNAAENKMTVHLKINASDDKIVIDGTEYKLKNAHLEYVPFKPGDSGTLASSLNSCSLPLAVFSWTGISIGNYDVDVDALQYYFRTEWDGPKGAVYHAYIEATPPAQYFTLRASDMTTEVGYDWDSHTDCTTTP